MRKNILKNKKGNYVNFKFVSIILVLIVLVFVLIGIFKFDILKKIDFLPEYEDPDTESSDLREDVYSDLGQVIKEEEEEYEKNKCGVDKTFCSVENLEQGKLCECPTKSQWEHLQKTGEKSFDKCSLESACFPKEEGCIDFDSEFKKESYSAAVNCKGALGNEHVDLKKCQVQQDNEVINAPCHCPSNTAQGKFIEESFCHSGDFCYLNTAGCKYKELFAGEKSNEIEVEFTENNNDLARFYWDYGEDRPAMLINPNERGYCENILLGPQNLRDLEEKRCFGQDFSLEDKVTKNILREMSNVLSSHSKENFCRNIFNLKTSTNIAKIQTNKEINLPGDICEIVFNIDNLANFPEE